MLWVEILEKDPQRLLGASQENSQPLRAKCRAQPRKPALDLSHPDAAPPEPGEPRFERSHDRTADPLVDRRSLHAGLRSSAKNQRSTSASPGNPQSACSCSRASAGQMMQLA